MEAKYDAVIIGSGLGGLVSACILSKNGMKVAVFEKHSVAGGCLQTFRRGGVSFETGMHYIGSMQDGEVLNRYFKYLGICDRLPLQKLDEQAYEIISCGGSRYCYANGHEAFVDGLAGQFPHNTGDIRKYVDMCARVTASSPMYSFGEHGDKPLINPEHVNVSASGTIESITSDPVLRNVLAGISPLYGGEKDVTPLYIHSLIWDFYNRGAYRIAGGSDKIAIELCRQIEAMGGEIYLSHAVTAINTEDNMATSVTVEGIGTVECSYVISDIHPELVLDLVEGRVFRPVYRERIKSMKQTVSNFTVFMKFKPDMVPYFNSNFFHYSGDVWDSTSYEPSSWPGNFLYMHQCSEVDQKFASHAIVFGYMDWRDVEKWADTRVGQRGPEYLEFKEMCKEKLLDSLSGEFPGIRSCIEDCWTSSPLTYRDYTGTVNGSMYGILHDTSRLSQTTVSQRTKIGNLFLAGQNINSHGILGVTIGAVLACSEILGFDYLMTQIKQETK